MHFVIPIHLEWRPIDIFTSIPAILFNPIVLNVSLQSTILAVT